MRRLLLVAALGLALPARAASDYAGHLDNARLYIRQGYLEDALEELEQAVAHEEGRLDPEAWLVLAQVRFELGDLEGARQAASRAHSYSRTPEETREAHEFSAFLQEQFGILVVRAPWEGVASRLDLELESVLFDPALKRYLARLEEGELRKKVVLPLRLGVPAATYRLNGLQVTVPPGGEAEVELGSDSIDARGPASTQLAQAEIAAGMGSWLGGRVSNLLPAPTVQLALSQPVGPLVAGIAVDWTPQPYLLAEGTAETSPLGWALGARVGYELRDTQPLVIRASLGYRYATVPGVELACTAGGDGYACSRDGPADLYLYAIGRAHSPLVELSVDYLDRSRTRTVGAGVKTIVEQALGTVPATGEARVVAAEDSVTYQVGSGSRAWTATGVRVMLDISLAF